MGKGREHIVGRLQASGWLQRGAVRARSVFVVLVLRRAGPLAEVIRGGGVPVSELPDDFSWREYLELNPDLLAGGITTRLRAIEHYLVHGREELRRYHHGLGAHYARSGSRRQRGPFWRRSSLRYPDVLTGTTLRALSGAGEAGLASERRVRAFLRSAQKRRPSLGGDVRADSAIYLDLAQAAFSFGHLDWARRAAGTALERRPDNLAAQSLLFEIHLERNEVEPASKWVKALLAGGWDNPQAYIRYAHLARGEEKIEPGGTAVLKEAIERFPGSTLLAIALKEHCAKRWSRANVATEKLLLAGEREQAIESLERATRAYLDDMTAIYQERQASPAGSSVLLIGDAHLPQCLRYRIRQKQEQLASAGRECEFVSWREHGIARNHIPFHDTIVFYRVPGLPAVLELIVYAKSLGKRLYYEIDDFLFNEEYYPPPIGTYGGSVTPTDYVGLQRGATYFRTAMALFDAFIVSTEPLREQVIELFGDAVTVLVHRNGLDSALTSVRPASLSRPGDRVRIFYGTGTKSHNEDFELLVAPALVALLRRHDHLEFICAGYLELPDSFEEVMDRVRMFPLIEDLEVYYTLLSECDINIAPLIPDTVNNCKSELKWFEAALMGVPSVLSPTQNYLDVVPEGHALFASDADEWESALERLVTDSWLRSEFAARSREYALEHYSPQTLGKALHALLPASDRKARKCKKIVFVNVFYYPQSIGGATRIFESSIAGLRERYGDEFEIAVFTSDAQLHSEYDLEEYWLDGVRVTRVQLPIIHNFEWNYTNDRLREIFDEYLRREAPDLVNFHCIQRLTGSVVDAALARGIPYFITVHDAWWLSDFQFLITPDGTLCGDRQLDPVSAEYREDIGREASIKRKLHLKRLMDNAENVISVSRAFRELYRINGVNNAVVCQNGISPEFLHRRRTRSAHRKRTVIGLIGGLSAHKGYDLLMEVLAAHRFENLAFLFVDHSRSAGYRQDAHTELNAITYVGKVPHQDVLEMYDQIDVLAAPSLWPESYGLVTREALAYGLWVIASDRGAIGEDVAHGDNGFVVDVSGPGPLTNVLHSINADHERYQSPPPGDYRPRTTHDQVEDLARLFRSHLSKGSGHEDTEP